MRTNKIPKTLLKEIQKNSHIVESYHMEEDGFGGPDQGAWSIWIDLKEGYRCSFSDTSCIHEATARDAIEALKSVQTTYQT